MSSPPAAPRLLREDDKTQWCLNTTAVRDFLRLSRASSDDSISAHLNSLLTPGQSNPYVSRAPAAFATPRGDRRNVSEETCALFKHRVLFPGWSTRDSILTTCSAVADRLQPSSSASPNTGSKNYWGSEQTVNERLDPYSARDYEWTRSSQADQLRDVLQNEARTESIIRSRSWSVLGERCVTGASSGQTEDKGWQSEYRMWASQQAPS